MATSQTFTFTTVSNPTCWAGTPTAFEEKMVRPLGYYALEQLRARLFFAATTTHNKALSARVVLQMALETEIGVTVRRTIPISSDILSTKVCERRRYLEIDQDLKKFQFLIEPALQSVIDLNILPEPYVRMFRVHLESPYAQYRVCAVAALIVIGVQGPVLEPSNHALVFADEVGVAEAVDTPDNLTIEAEDTVSTEDTVYVTLNPSQVFLIGGIHIPAGLHPTALVEMWDEATGVWSQMESMPAPRYNHLSFYLNGQAVTACGTTSSEGGWGDKVIQAYDIGTDTWSTVGEAYSELYRPVGVLVPAEHHPDGFDRLYMIGGAQHSGESAAAIDDVRELQTEDNYSTNYRASLSSPIQAHWATFVLIDDVPHIFVAGGWEVSDQSAWVTARLYNVATDTWTTVAPMPAGIDSPFGVVFDDGRIMVMGNGSSYALTTMTGFIYNPADDTWEESASRGATLHGSPLIKLLDGRILASGGAFEGGGSSALCSIYDPDNDTWTPTGSMTRARSYMWATRLNNGRVLVVGGEGALDSMTTAEVYDPDTGVWTQTGSIAEPGRVRFGTGQNDRIDNGLVLVLPPAGEEEEPVPLHWIQAIASATAAGPVSSIEVPNTIGADIQVGDRLIVVLAWRGDPNQFGSGWVTSTGWLDAFGAGFSTGSTNNLQIALGSKIAEAADQVAASWTFDSAAHGGASATDDLQAAVLVLRGVQNNIVGFSPQYFSANTGDQRVDELVFPHPNIGELLGPSGGPRGAITVMVSSGVNGVCPVHSPTSGLPAKPVHTVAYYEATQYGAMQIAEVVYDITQVSTFNVPIGHDQISEDGVTTSNAILLTFPIEPTAL